MKNIFGNDKDKGEDITELHTGGFEKMVKMRKEKLPEIEESIRDVLKNYDGQSICIITITEDENGDPIGNHTVMGGVGKLESQLAMAKSLSKASDQAMEVLMESARGDTKAMLALAMKLAEDIGIVDGDKKKGKK